uniref:Uncharacterized protein n=1 Tax=Physcomitrium patens TaxID=3218 RepID=A0A2K1KKL9_PHYPA|nr:hypothetical protein PHYPA_008005 [Physcomitrium patens]
MIPSKQESQSPEMMMEDKKDSCLVVALYSMRANKCKDIESFRRCMLVLECPAGPSLYSVYQPGIRMLLPDTGVVKTLPFRIEYSENLNHVSN